MTKDTRSCASRLLVESAFDGRLDRRDLAAVERHLDACAECAAWAAGLHRLRAEVRRDLSTPPSPFEQARSRLELLRRAAGDPDGAGEETRHFAWIAAALSIFGVIAVLAWSQRTRPIGDVARFGGAIPLAAKVTFTASSASDFSVARDSRAFDLKLLDGTVALWVRKLGAEQRVLVTTRDASVEVRGTVFQVTAEHGKLVGVHVDGGVVEVRRGDERHLLHAGERLDLRDARPDEDDATISGSSPIAREGEPKSARAGRRARPVALRAPQEPAASPVRAPEPKAPVATAAGDAAANDFAHAVKNLDYADYPKAAQELATFVKRHPDDARAEDAAFLTVVALQKTGRNDEMRAAARDYLRRFPNGARAADVRRWSDAP